MAGRYFYGPVDPGYGAMGAGIAGGISQGVGNFVGMRDRARRHKREDDADARQKIIDGQRDATFDMGIVNAGGGAGPAPTMQRDVDLSGGLRLPRIEPTGPLFEGPTEPALNRIGTDWIRQQGPQLEAPQLPSSMTVETPDPRFRTIGSGDQQYHIEDPQYREARGREQLNEQRTQSIGTVAASLRARNPDMTEDEARAEAATVVDGFARFADINPQETFGQAQPTDGGFAQFGNRGSVRQHSDVKPRPLAGPVESWTPRPSGDGNYHLISNRGRTQATNITVPQTGAGGGGVTPTAIYTRKAQRANNYLTERRRIDEQKRIYGLSATEYDEAVAAANERWGFKDYAEARALTEAGEAAASGQLGVDLTITDDDEFESDDGHEAAVHGGNGPPADSAAPAARAAAPARTPPAAGGAARTPPAAGGAASTPPAAGGAAPSIPAGRLSDTEVTAIARSITSRNVETQKRVLNRLSPEQKAQVLQKLPPEQRRRLTEGQ
jgi:hypothetical protein